MIHSSVEQPPLTLLFYRFLQRTFKETSPPRTVIKNNEGRFGTISTGLKSPDNKAIASPGPTSYEIEKSHKYANEFRGREMFSKTKRVSFCEQQARLNISPGPAKHSHSIKLLDKLSPSPHRSSRNRI